NLGHPIQPASDVMVEPEVFDTILGHLDALATLSIPASRDWNPIAAYDAMAGGNDIVYIPFAFGYSNYAREGARRLIRFTPVDGPGPAPSARALLGAAGCAISSECRHVEAAVTYLSWVHRPEHQAGDYFREGGQPGLRTAWTDEATNAAC